MVKRLAPILLPFLMLAFAPSALAGGGSTSADGCHNQKGTKAAHCHEPVKVERLNKKFKKGGGNTYRVTLKSGNVLVVRDDSQKMPVVPIVEAMKSKPPIVVSTIAGKCSTAVKEVVTKARWDSWDGVYHLTRSMRDGLTINCLN